MATGIRPVLLRDSRDPETLALVANTADAVTYDLLTLDLVVISPDVVSAGQRRRFGQVV